MAAQPHHHHHHTTNDRNEQDSWLNGGQHRPYPEHDPYQTPRLNTQQRTPRAPYVPPQDIPPVHGDYSAYGHNAYGHRARSTIPMPYQPQINDDIEVRLRGKCRNCEGNGTVPGRITQCEVCHRRYTFEMVKLAQHYGWRGRRVMLPCGHEVMETQILWTRPPCMYCEGEGYLYRWIRWSEFVETLYGAEELDEQTTTALRALGRAAGQPQAQVSASFYQSEPSAPTPHLASGGPVISPHLPPVSPVSPMAPVAPPATPTEF